MSNPRFEAAVAAFERWTAAAVVAVVRFMLQTELQKAEAESQRLTALLEEERPEYEAALAEIEEMEAVLKEQQEFVVYGEDDAKVVIHVWENTDHRPQVYALTTLAQDMLSNRPNPIPFKTSF